MRTMLDAAVLFITKTMFWLLLCKNFLSCYCWRSRNCLKKSLILIIPVPSKRHVKPTYIDLLNRWRSESRWTVSSSDLLNSKMPRARTTSHLHAFVGMLCENNTPNWISIKTSHRSPSAKCFLNNLSFANCALPGVSCVAILICCNTCALGC